MSKMKRSHLTPRDAWHSYNQQRKKSDSADSHLILSTFAMSIPNRLTIANEPHGFTFRSPRRHPLACPRTTVANSMEIEPEEYAEHSRGRAP